jgi:ribonuclease BN (tRNA processing enzyme)
MFAVTLLGTSASVPSADRNHPGLLVEAGGDRVLVDCGEGTQRQFHSRAKYAGIFCRTACRLSASRTDRYAKCWPRERQRRWRTAGRSIRRTSSVQKLVVVGDTETTDGLSKHVRNADVLVIEATFLDRDSEMARDYGHLTAAKAAALALESNVKQLVLNHISGRYPEEEILAEAAMIFPDSRVAADFDRFVV